MTTPRQVLDLAISEEDFQKMVIQLAQLHGWKVAHFRAARTATGWRTAVEANGAGFPDLFMVNKEKHRGLALEVKRESGRLTDAQRGWLTDMQACGIPAYEVKPSMWEELLSWLT